MRAFFATFGHGSPFFKKFIGIIAPDRLIAEEAMCDSFMRKWSHVYPVFSPDERCELVAQARALGLTALCHLRVLVIDRFTGLNVQLISEAEFGREINSILVKDSENQMTVEHTPQGLGLALANLVPEEA